MGLRNWINKNSGVSTFIVIFTLVIAAGVLFSNTARNSKKAMTYFYDLNSRSILADTASREVPFDNGNGTFMFVDGERGSVVPALIYTCGSPEEVRSGMTVEELDRVGAFVLAVFYTTQSSDQLVANPEAMQWFPTQSMAASAIYDAIGTRCEGKKAVRCLPQ